MFWCNTDCLGANALRRTPGIMKLIEARIFKFDDFLTDGSLDMRKLPKVRRVLAKLRTSQ